MGDLVSEKKTIPITFIGNPEETKMFGPLRKASYTFEVSPMTYNSHKHGISLTTFNSNKGITSIFKATSTSVDENGLEFVSSMESTKYPFYGTQFHPEKEQFSFYPEGHFEHNEETLAFNRYFADFFVSEAKQNTNKFDTY
jgi:gamma-glutamyl hydrolase